MPSKPLMIVESEPKGRGPSQYSKGGFGVGPTRSIDDRFGAPLRDDLSFLVLAKEL